MRIGSWIVLGLVLLLEGTVTTLPLTFIFLLCLIVVKRADWVFWVALISGIILDMLSLRPIGVTSLIFIVFIFFILLYERKYEIATIPFVAVASFIGSFLFLHILQYGSIFEVITSCILATTFFILYQLFHKPGLPAHLDYRKV